MFSERSRRSIFRPDGLASSHPIVYAEIGPRDPERFGELGGDDARGGGAVQAQLGKSLGADHPPHPVQPAGHRGRVDANSHRARQAGRGTGGNGR